MPNSLLNQENQIFSIKRIACKFLNAQQTIKHLAKKGQNLRIKACLALLLVLCLSPFSVKAEEYSTNDSDYQLRLAKAVDVTNLGVEGTDLPNEQLVQLKLLDGPDKGEVYLARNLVPENLAYSIVAKEGKDYVVALNEMAGEVYITDYYRAPVLIFLVVLFFALLILIGGTKGVKAILSLLLIFVAIAYMFLPAVKHGFNPILSAILVSAFATATTMLLVAGFNRKALAATIGTVGGVTVGGILAYIMIKLAPLTGLASSEARILLGNLDGDLNAFNFQGVLAAGVLIASLGAAMDVAISIASAAYELHLSNARQSSAELFMHCMNVGKDIMGTMTNTLILAYTGSAITLFLLLMEEPITKIMNLEVIVTELTSAVIGSIGLLLAIPITASVSVFLLKGKQS